MKVMIVDDHFVVRSGLVASLELEDDITVVAESGIFTAQDVERLEKANIDAILVGEALVTSEDIPAKVRELSGMESQKSKV